ncbi:inositol monophosphatase family protein [Propioniciclava soli]|uniref:Inositol monophosphatase n=1 Tax=Propioniciclava soli TaxID=2775081 RepID=A0ABZ3C3D6_9ACTN|nr:inositol monophosphatase [Propioniciclava soli]
MDATAIENLLVDVAERVILPRFRTLAEHEIDQKRPGDLVTIADREAEVEIARTLAEAFPDAVIIGEEATFADADLPAGLPGAAHAFVIDPVDGTRNFAHGHADFGVMLAETRHGEATRAWIWQPVHQQMYAVEKGAGVTRNGVALPALTPPDRPWRVATRKRFRGDGHPDLQFTGTRGACAVDYPRLLEGDVDALVYTSQHAWDHLPGTLMLTELGGVAASSGAEPPWRPGQDGRYLLAAAGDDVLAALQEHAATR